MEGLNRTKMGVRHLTTEKKKQHALIIDREKYGLLMLKFTASKLGKNIPLWRLFEISIDGDKMFTALEMVGRKNNSCQNTRL
jgi:hypothetical protein